MQDNRPDDIAGADVVKVRRTKRKRRGLHAALYSETARTRHEELAANGVQTVQPFHGDDLMNGMVQLLMNAMVQLMNNDARLVEPAIRNFNG